MLHSLTLSIFLVLSSISIKEIAGKTCTNPNNGVSACGGFCRFSLCEQEKGITAIKDGSRVYVRNEARLGNGPWACVKTGTDFALMMKVNTKEALVAPPRTCDAFVPISSFRSDDVNRPYSLNYFRLVPHRPSGGSSIARARSSRSQNDLINDVCVKVPITQYEFRTENGDTEIVSLDDADNNCVSFRMRAPRLLIVLSWDTADDLDIVVNEPSGEVLRRNNVRTTSGVLVRNGGKRTSCSETAFNREEAAYDGKTPVPTGRWRVDIKQFLRCKPGPIKWAIEVFKDGNSIAKKERIHTIDSEDVDELFFSF